MKKIFLFTIFVVCSFVNALAGVKQGVVHVDEYLYDYSVSGGTTGTYTLTSSLPTSGIVTGYQLQVHEPLTSSGSATFTIGNSASGTAYVGDTAYSTFVDNYVNNHQGLASTALWDDSNDAEKMYLIDGSTKNDVLFEIGTAHLTGGKFSIWFYYIVPENGD